MSRLYISEELRRLIAERADYLCEYRLIHEEDTFLGCPVDRLWLEWTRTRNAVTQWA